MTARRTVLTIFGTRPEAIKLASVIEELRRKASEFRCVVCCTGQHREMVRQVIDALDIDVDVNLDSMTASQTLAQLTSRLFKDLDAVIETAKPDWVLVQGDTTSAMVAATCAFYRKISVGHVEAGLRTHNRWAPFPEEINRIFISRVADLHFAPTERAARRLREEGVSADAVHVTGNTVVDALRRVREQIHSYKPGDVSVDAQGFFDRYRVLLVTSHRRESFGRGLENICRAIAEIVGVYPDVAVIYPVHLNPNVRDPVHRILGRNPRIALMEPVNYFSLLYLMERCHLILTDSGGLQEEAPSFGKPVLVLRETTERPEAIDAGCARLVGTSREGIVNALRELLDKPAAYKSMVATSNPFGDGESGRRIVELLMGAAVERHDHPPKDA